MMTKAQKKNYVEEMKKIFSSNEAVMIAHYKGLNDKDLDKIRVDIGRIEGTIENCESIILKMLDRWNKSDDTSQRHREDIVKELNDVTDDLAYLKGRINGRQQ